MDYFKIFDLDRGFNIDPKKLKIKYLKLSKEFHPDFHTNASPMEQVKILERSTELNKAYKTLSDPDALLHYMLDSEGLLDGKPDELPQAFLFEMMSFNERIMDARMEPDPVEIHQIQAEYSEIKDALDEDLNNAKDDYDQGKADQVLKTLRFLYFKKKYLNRVEEHMEKLNDILES